MGKYFTEEQLDGFMTAYLAQYPDTIERWFYMMDHQGVVHGKLTSQTKREMMEVAKTASFFTAYAENLQRELLESAGGEFQANVPFKHKGAVLNFNPNLLAYRDNLKSRLVDQLGLQQAGFELFWDVTARLRNRYSQERGDLGAASPYFPGVEK